VTRLTRKFSEPYRRETLQFVEAYRLIKCVPRVVVLYPRVTRHLFYIGFTVIESRNWSTENFRSTRANNNDIDFGDLLKEICKFDSSR